MKIRNQSSCQPGEFSQKMLNSSSDTGCSFLWQIRTVNNTLRVKTAWFVNDTDVVDMFASSADNFAKLLVVHLTWLIFALHRPDKSELVGACVCWKEM